MSTPLSEQQLHNLAMNIVGKALQELNWEFLLVNSDMKKNPQFVCVDPKKNKHFIIVKAVCENIDPDIHNTKLLKKVKQHAERFNAKTHYAGVGLYHGVDPNKKVCKDEPYQVYFKGLLTI